MAMIVQPMRSSDIDSVLEIEGASFVTPWHRNAFLYELENRNARNYIIRPDPVKIQNIGDGPRLYGYACFHVAANELHLLKMAVAPDMRKNNIAFQLLDACFRNAAADDLDWVFLEVRRSNASAIRLYEKLGFCRIAARCDYYRRPEGGREDALIMRKTLKGGNTWQ